MSDTQTSRYERKFVISELSKPEIELVIKQHPAVFTEIYKERIINNIYLDTPNLTFYLDNAFGKSNRKKVRIRWYGDLFGNIEKPVLEFKLKTSAVGDKLSFSLKPFDLNGSFNIDTLHQVFRKSNLPAWVMEDILPLKPQLLNRYCRKYFRTIDKLFRATIDSNLVYQDISTRNNSFRNRMEDWTNTIVELKYSFEVDKQANNVTTNFPFRLTKSSKYVNGIEYFNSNVAV